MFNRRRRTTSTLKNNFPVQPRLSLNGILHIRRRVVISIQQLPSTTTDADIIGKKLFISHSKTRSVFTKTINLKQQCKTYT